MDTAEFGAWSRFISRRAVCEGEKRCSPSISVSHGSCAEAAETTEEKEDDIGLHGNFTWSAAESHEDRHRDRSRSPAKGAALSAAAPSTMGLMPQAPLGDGSAPSGGLEVTPEQAWVLKAGAAKDSAGGPAGLY